MELLFGNHKVVEADVPQQSGEQVRLEFAAAAAALLLALLSLLAAGPHSSVLHSLWKTNCLRLPSSQQLTVAVAMAWARDHLLTERPELFMKGSSV